VAPRGPVAPVAPLGPVWFQLMRFSFVAQLALESTIRVAPVLAL
jgi:hypothetical protein